MLLLLHFRWELKVLVLGAVLGGLQQVAEEPHLLVLQQALASARAVLMLLLVVLACHLAILLGLQHLLLPLRRQGLGPL